MTLVGDLGEVAREFQAHSFPRADLAPPFAVEPFEEIGDRDAQHPGDLPHPAGRDAVDAALVFVRLLVGDADEVGELLLRQTEHDAALADAGADMAVDVLCPTRGSLHSVALLMVSRVIGRKVLIVRATVPVRGSDPRSEARSRSSTIIGSPCGSFR